MTSVVTPDICVTNALGNDMALFTYWSDADFYCRLWTAANADNILRARTEEGVILQYWRNGVALDPLKDIDLITSFERAARMGE